MAPIGPLDFRPWNQPEFTKVRSRAHVAKSCNKECPVRRNQPSCRCLGDLSTIVHCPQVTDRRALLPAGSFETVQKTRSVKDGLGPGLMYADWQAERYSSLLAKGESENNWSACKDDGNSGSWNMCPVLWHPERSVTAMTSCSVSFAFRRGVLTLDIKGQCGTCLSYTGAWALQFSPRIDWALQFTQPTNATRSPVPP